MLFIVMVTTGKQRQTSMKCKTSDTNSTYSMLSSNSENSTNIQTSLIAAVKKFLVLFKHKKAKQMLSSDLNGEVNKNNNNSHEGSEKAYPRGKPCSPVTPKMLVKALKRLNKNSFKRILFTPQEITYEILRTYPEVEQDYRGLLLEISDKLNCAAAAGLVGTKQDLGYFALGLRHREPDSRSELMFWIFYKKILKKRAEERKLGKPIGFNFVPQKEENNKEKKVVRLVPFAGDNLHIFPLIRCRRDTRNA